MVGDAMETTAGTIGFQRQYASGALAARPLTPSVPAYSLVKEPTTTRWYPGQRSGGARPDRRDGRAAIPSRTLLSYLKWGEPMTNADWKWVGPVHRTGRVGLALFSSDAEFGKLLLASAFGQQEGITGGFGPTEVNDPIPRNQEQWICFAIRALISILSALVAGSWSLDIYIIPDTQSQAG